MMGVAVGNGVAEGVDGGVCVEDGVNVTAISVGGKVDETPGGGVSFVDCVGVTNEETAVGVGDGAAGAKSVHQTHNTSNNKMHAKINTPMAMAMFRCIVTPPNCDIICLFQYTPKQYRLLDNVYSGLRKLALE